jgi:molybdate transport system substrate-binding protein
MRGRLLLIAVAVLATALAGCGGGSAGRADGSTAGGGRAVTGEIDVFAAASLTEAFGELGTDFEAAHPGSHVTFDFGASSELAAQIAQGAPADVFASADRANAEAVVRAGLASGPPEVFATNSLTILVERGNPRHVRSLADLAAPELSVVLCATEVPCGKYAAQILSTAGVAVTPRSLEQNVKGVVTKVTTGEADAGIVYVTDAAAAADRTDQVDIPTARNAVATYPVVALRDASNRRGAAAFVDFVTGRTGRRVLARHGFGRP